MPVRLGAVASASGTVDKTVEPAHRAEIKAKLANFVRAPWFAPPFGGPQLTNLLLDAFDAMDEGPPGAPLLPDYQPLDLFVTVTDFRGYPEQLRLNSPPEVIETEHRLTLVLPGSGRRRRAPSPTRPSSSSPRARRRASPAPSRPSRSASSTRCLDERGQAWPGRAAFLARALPAARALGEAEEAVLIDGSVLANAPFGPAIAALEKRPARREVDRRFVYIDPKPGMKSVRLGGARRGRAAGLLRHHLRRALRHPARAADPRQSRGDRAACPARIRRLRRIIETMRPEVEAAIERAVGSSFFLDQPDRRSGSPPGAPRRTTSPPREAGYAYAAYGQLKIADRGRGGGRA